MNRRREGILPERVEQPRVQNRDRSSATTARTGRTAISSCRRSLARSASSTRTSISWSRARNGRRRRPTRSSKRPRAASRPRGRAPPPTHRGDARHCRRPGRDAGARAPRGDRAADLRVRQRPPADPDRVGAGHRFRDPAGPGQRASDPRWAGRGCTDRAGHPRRIPTLEPLVDARYRTRVPGKGGREAVGTAGRVLRLVAVRLLVLGGVALFGPGPIASQVLGIADKSDEIVRYGQAPTSGPSSSASSRSSTRQPRPTGCR